jgi:hypothetical protein
MTRRRLLTLSALLLVSLIGIGVYWAMQPKPGVTLENFRQLNRGMSEEQVETILGSKGVFEAEVAGASLKSWRGPQGQVVLAFGGFYGRDHQPFIGLRRGAWYYGLDAQASEQLGEPKPLGIAEKTRRWVEDWTGW